MFWNLFVVVSFCHQAVFLAHQEFFQAYQLPGDNLFRLMNGVMGTFFQSFFLEPFNCFQLMD